MIVSCSEKVPVRGASGMADGTESGVVERPLMIEVPGPAEPIGQGVLCPQEVRHGEDNMVAETLVPEVDGLRAERQDLVPIC